MNIEIRIRKNEFVMPSRSYQSSDYLTTPQERAAYLNAALEENDLHLFLTALRNISRSEGKLEQSLNSQTYQVPFHQLGQEVSSLLHGLGLRLAVIVEKQDEL